MTAQVGQFGFLLQMVVTAIGCATMSLALPHDSYIRYQTFKGTIFEKLPWSYERIHYDKRPIDIVFLGSSRMGGGAIPSRIEQELAELGHPLKVVNISIPAAGLDVRSAQLKEVLSRRKIKLLVYGVVETLPREGHQAFGDLANVTEILASPWLVNLKLPFDIARLPFRQMKLSLASAMPEVFGYRREFDELHYSPFYIKDLAGDGTLERETADANSTDDDRAKSLDKESKRRKRTINPPILPDRLSFIEFGVSQHYVRELKELSQQHQFDVVFLFQPFFHGYESPTDETYLKQFGPVWNATYMIDDADSFLDVAHVSPMAAETLSIWLAKKIVSHMEVKP